MNFATMAKAAADCTYTENGGKAFSTTGGGSLLDLFANIGGMRKRDELDIVSAWAAARKENKELADNLILYARSIRTGGLGERRIGRILLKQLATYDPDKIINNFDTIVDCGRWDDLFIFIGTPAEAAMWDYVENQIKSDINGILNNQPISLLGKWLKSENTSSNESRLIAKRTRSKLNLTAKQYRKMLSKLRKYINVLEAKISRNDWDSINFEQVPSLAMKRYLNAFGRHCYEAFGNYKSKLVKGEAKVNAATLYPGDLVKTILYSNSYDPIVTEEQWKALPNYVKGDQDVVCVVDTSGSMYGDPICYAVGLGIYFAQRNKGAYHNIYFNFSGNPKVNYINDSWNLYTCVERVRRAEWGFNTDLDRCYELIYRIAIKSNDVPKALIVLSDMEIDQWGSKTYAKSITQKWADAYSMIGLKAPRLIYWNIASRHDNTLAQCDENVAYVSGASAGAFKFLQTLIDKNAYEAMVEILSRPEFTWK